MNRLMALLLALAVVLGTGAACAKSKGRNKKDAPQQESFGQTTKPLPVVTKSEKKQIENSKKSTKKKTQSSSPH